MAHRLVIRRKSVKEEADKPTQKAAITIEMIWLLTS